MMLGGRSSFGAGGWAGTPIADILPVDIHPGDGQLEPEGGIKFVPSTEGLDSYVLQVGANRAETAKIWDALPPILGTNRFGEPKAVGQDPGRRRRHPTPSPLMLSMETGKSRVDRLRRRHLGLGPVVRGGPARPSQVLEAGHLLAVAQGKRQREPGQADARPPPGRRSARSSRSPPPPATPRGLPSPTSTTRPRSSAKGRPRSPSRSSSTTRATRRAGSIYATEKIGQPGNYTVTIIATPRRPGDRPRHGAVPRLPGRPRAGKPVRRPQAGPRDRRDHRRRAGHPRTPGQLLEGHRPVRLHRVPEPLRVQGLGQLAVPLDLHRDSLTLEWWLRKRHGWV